MDIKLKSKTYDLKFTYNSFKYLGDFDISELTGLDTKPFKMIQIAETLLLGAVNNNPKQVVRLNTVQEYIENLIEEEGDLVGLIEELSNLLTESSFFKCLQKKK